jgi:hypothetical protein
MIEDFRLDPVTGAFDVAEIEHRLATTPIAVRDEAVSTTFMIFDDAGAARRGVDERRRDPSQFPYQAALVRVSPERIAVGYRLGGKEALRGFVRWLATRYQLRYRDETFRDLTASVDPELDFLFGARR